MKTPTLAYELDPIRTVEIKPYQTEELFRLESLPGFFDCERDFYEAEVTYKPTGQKATFWLSRKAVGRAWVVWYPSGKQWPGVEGSKKNALWRAINEAWLHA